MNPHVINTKICRFNSVYKFLELIYLIDKVYNVRDLHKLPMNYKIELKYNSTSQAFKLADNPINFFN